MKYFWFPYTALLINLLLIWFMPKKLTRKEIYVTWGVLAAITYFADVYTGLTLDLFDLGPKDKAEFSTTFLEGTLAPSFGIIFLNFMPIHRSSYVKYLIYWVLFSTFFEWLTLKFNYMDYKGWKLWYSTVVYILVFIFLRWHLRFIRKNQ